MEYTGSLFGKASSQKVVSSPVPIDRLVEMQTEQLLSTYGTSCLDVQQLQQVFNAGESKVYEWMKECKAVRKVGRRKVVPVVAVAVYLITGNY